MSHDHHRPGGLSIDASPPAATETRRIFVVGGPGSGKTTLTRLLSERMGIVLYELDRVVYGDGSGTTCEPRALAAFVDQVAAEDSWVVDGNYAPWVDPLLAKADLIILLDVPRLTAMWRVLKREVIGKITGKVTGLRSALFWRFMRSCWRYYFDERGRLGSPELAPTHSATGAALTRFATVRRCRDVDDVAAHVSAPPDSALAARRARVAMVDAGTACMREFDRDRTLWFWFDAADPCRSVYLAITSLYWTDRLVGTSLPQRWDSVTGRRQPVPVGQRLALLTARESSRQAAMRALEASGLRLEVIERRTIAGGRESFDVTIVVPTPSPAAVVYPLRPEAMMPSHGAVQRHGAGVRILTPRGRWHYAASLDLASACPDPESDGIGYVHVTGSLARGPIGIGIVARDGVRFLSRRALSVDGRPVDVYLPIPRVGDAASMVVQTWGQPICGELTIDSIELICERREGHA